MQRVGGNDTGTWDARWLARISRDSGRAATPETSERTWIAIALTHVTLLMTAAVLTGGAWVFALAAVGVVGLLVKQLLPRLKHLFTRREPAPPSPFGR
jgi:hypothetical protein